MSKKYKGRIPDSFFWVLQATVKSEAWKALSHGARSLYAILMRRYNLNLQNAVWVSSRDAPRKSWAGTAIATTSNSGFASFSITASLSWSARLTTASTATAKRASLAADGSVVSRQGTDARFLGLGWLAVHREEEEERARAACPKKQNPRRPRGSHPGDHGGATCSRNRP